MKFGRKYVSSGLTKSHKHNTHVLNNCISLTNEHSLPRNQVPEWAGSYINYKALKKLVKALSRAAQDGEQVDLAGGHPRTQPDPFTMLLGSARRTGRDGD